MRCQILLTVSAQGIFVYSYRIFLHPLHAYPGPFAAKFTDWYGAYHAFFRRLHFVTYHNHERYGESEERKEMQS